MSKRIERNVLTKWGHKLLEINNFFYLLITIGTSAKTTYLINHLLDIEIVDSHNSKTDIFTLILELETYSFFIH